MSLSGRGEARCAYCNWPVISATLAKPNDPRIATRDHIFPNFLGGRRQIVACKSCNDGFGSAFEGVASWNLSFLAGALSIQGIPFHLAPAGLIKEGYESEGVTYDLRFENGVLTPELSKPHRILDDRGRPIQVTARTFRELENERKAAARKHSGVVTSSIAKNSLRHSGPIPFKPRFEYRSELYFAGLKMAVALASTLPAGTYSEILPAASQLKAAIHKARESGARDKQAFPGVLGPCNAHPDFRNHIFLDQNRPPLSHVVYVERCRGTVNAIVQFFGSIQLFCAIGPASTTQPAAILGVLNPLAGTEQFTPMNPLQVEDETPIDIVEGVAKWNAKLIAQAAELGHAIILDSIPGKVINAVDLISGNRNQSKEQG